MAKKKKAPARKKKTAKVIKKNAVAKKKPAKKSKKTKTAAKVKLKPSVVKAKVEGTKLGEVEDYFSRIGVIALTLKSAVGVGDTLRVKGHTTDLTQKVESMQIEHASVQSAKKGNSIGIKVNEKCRKGDEVYRVN